MANHFEGSEGSDKAVGGDQGAGKSENLNPERTVTGAQIKEAADTNPNKFISMTEMPALSAPLTPGERDAARAFDSFGLIMPNNEVLTGQGLQPPDAAPAGSAEDTGTVVDYQPVQTGDASYALGMDWEKGPDQRTPAEKLSDFVQAATARATDSQGWQKYIDGQVEKFLGIGEGLNIAKDHTKDALVAGWRALTDGTVANFLAKPNAINDPLFQAVGSAFDAMANDPNAVNHALERLGTAAMEASEHYSTAPDREKGKIIGETMFFMVNPEGSTEAGEAALKIADTVATHVDKAVMDGIRASVRAAEDMAATSPELADQARRMLYEYTRKLGLSPQEMELAGIPKGYFDGIEGVGAERDHYFAMSKADDIEGKGPLRGRQGDTTHGIEYQIDKATGRLQRTDVGKIREPYKWQVIDEHFAPDVIRQSLDDSCVSAVGEMLSEGRLTEGELISRLGSPADIEELSFELGAEWTSQKGPTTLAEIGKGGPWAAEMLESPWSRFSKTPHVVIVDGPSPAGNVVIRDPLEGTRYEMTVKDFLKTWSGCYRRV